ncbi:MAG: hypothetical protein FWD57_01255 [Polyangiaceae bacterium]|nr:hypothetical protein [Polyangiaceae bacterium]
MVNASVCIFGLYLAIVTCENHTFDTIAAGNLNHAAQCRPRRTSVKELTEYLLENLYIDFQGEVSLDTVRGYLREDDSPEARRLLAKLMEDEEVNEMLITLADCLKDNIATGIQPDVIQEALIMYSES